VTEFKSAEATARGLKPEAGCPMAGRWLLTTGLRPLPPPVCSQNPLFHPGAIMAWVSIGRRIWWWP